MAKGKVTKQTPPRDRPGWSSRALPLAFFLAQVVVVPGAFSPYRQPKMAIAVTGIAAVVSIGLIVRMVQRRKLEVPAGRLAAVLLALPALQAVSALWGAVPGIALRSSLLSCVWIVGVLWIASLDVEQRLRLIHWTAAGAALSAVLALVQATVSSAALYGFEGEGDRLDLTGLTGNPSDLAMTSVFLLPLLLRRPAAILQRWIFWICPTLLIIAILATQTLTAYAALAAVSIFWALQQRSQKLWIFAAAVSAVIVVGFAWFGTTDRFGVQMNRLRSGNWYSLLSARNDGWTAAAQMTLEHPILGVGASHFSHSYYPSRLAWLEERDEVGRRGELATHFAWVHCDPLQAVAELGILGWLWLALLTSVLAMRAIRGDPLIVLAAGAVVPFAVIHYPTHVAVGLIPISLILAEAVHREPRKIAVTVEYRWLRTTLAVLLGGAVIWIAGWQARNLTLNVWRGGIEAVLTASENLDQSQRARLGAIIEEQTAVRAVHNAIDRSWLFRLAGRVRLSGGDGPGAETAFRAAHTLWPHEESEFGLGLALALQHRRNEALLHLGRVCRVNPALARLIPDPDLEESIDLLNRERRRRSR